MAHKHGLAAIHLAVFLFGLSGFIGKVLRLSAVGIVFSRALLAAVCLSGVLWLKSAGLRRARADLAFLVGSGVVLAVHWLTFFQAIQVSTVAIGLLSFASFPLFTTVLEPLVLAGRFQRWDWLTCALVTAGLMLVVPRFDLHHHLTQGVLWGIVSGLTFAVLSIWNRRHVQYLGAVEIAASQNGVAALMLLPFAGPALTHLTVWEALWLLFLGVFCTAGAHVLFIRGLRCVRAQVASVMTGLEPVYGILLAWAFLHEAPPVRTLLGGALILGATVVSAKDRGTQMDP